MDIKKILCELTSATGIGNIREATDKAVDLFKPFCQISYTDNLGIMARIAGESDYTLAVEAHIDQIGFIVTDIDDDGFLTVSSCGGIDLRMLPSRPVIIHSKKEVRGVFCSTPPHLSEKDAEYDKISDFKIDTALGGSAKDIIKLGDYVTFASGIYDLAEDRICSKSLDDRAGVAVLIELASRFADKKPPVNHVFCLSDMEEIGLRGAKTSSFDISPDEAIAIDVSFADGPDIPETDCGKLSGGPMIGISPVLDRAISNKLIKIAKEKGIPYQLEVMGRSTGTDADIISVTKSGVKTALVSIPLRNMHSDCEIISLSDVSSVCDLLENYIKAVK